MPGRNFSSNNYRYGFNGKENDPETSTQDYGMRIYNPALGKFLSVDPLSKNYPWNSTYAFAENRPIDGIDLDGEEFLSPLMDLADKVIPVLESGNANKTLVYSMKVFRGMANSSLEGNLRAITNEMKHTYSMSQKVLADPNTVESRQFVKEMIKHPETKALEGLAGVAKQAYKGDPDAIGFVAGTLLQMGVVKVATPRAGAIGDLSVSELDKIQNVVNEAGAPLDVVGSAAKGERLAPRLPLPIEKGYKSDIDYLISPDNMSNYSNELLNKLPYLDKEPIIGRYNPMESPRIKFTPGEMPASTKATVGATVIFGGKSVNDQKDK